MGKSNLDQSRIEHPSFATIAINRVSIGGGGIHLFDSPFKHYRAVSLEIAPAYISRSLHEDRVFGSGKAAHIRVYLSEVQFSNMVFNAGMNCGTPCTVDALAGERIPQPPLENLKKTWEGEVRKDFQDVADAAKEAEKQVDALLAKDRVTKADIKTLKDVISGLAQDLRENLPWLEKQFEKTMEKVVTSAKGEIQAHLAQAIQNSGLESLKKGMPLIGFDGKTEEGGGR